MIDDVIYIATVTMDVTGLLVLATDVTLVIGVATVIIFVQKIVKVVVEKLTDFAPCAGMDFIFLAFAMFRAVKNGQTVDCVS